MSGQRYSVTIDVGADISSAKSAAQQLKNVFEGIGLGAGQSSRISGMFRDLDKALDEVAKRSSTALTSIGEVKGLDKAKERVVSIINAINSEFAKMGKLGDTDLAKNFGDLTRRVNDATKAIKTYNSTIGSLSKGHAAAKSRANELGQELAEQTKYYEQLQKIRDKFKGSSDKDISEALAKRQSTAKGLATRRQNELESFVKARGGRINVDKTVDKGWRKSFESKASAEDVETLNKLVTAAQSASNAFKTAQENYQNFSNAMSNFKGQKNFDELTKNAREAADELKKFESGTLSTEAFNKLKSALEQAFGPEVTAGIQNSATAVEEFQERINQISAKELDEFRKKVPEIDNLLNQLANTGEKMGEKVKKGTESFYNMKEAASDIDNLTYRLKYFFSLAGGFQLMRRAIRSVVSTTKELDAAMTQTAVVSTYTVKDMWKTLPQYSKEASKLGTSIKDVYNAQTLYVQQGLDMNTAMEIGVETMKMARVANIGAEEATNSMTAALRGFNMAIDEKSAKRVNDVYSKLAQNTASNTQEISTAMTKTAAIANSANMSFENTAAFLATIIESTREGAETAGTALKTVIARFTEVKKLYSQKELKGTDAEGQEIDVNKISAALRTAGINLNDFFTGSKGLDEILMQLGSKWNNLSTVQQRYIATMAAGSRQQSRFLALMQNYERTVSLTEMAYNSAGSGQEQFEKTLDSLDAKINQLKNSWDTFLMGLANSEAIKGTIDFATSFLDILNKIVSALSGSSGLTKSLVTLSMTMGAFRIGRSVLGKGGLLTSLLKGEGVGSRLGKTVVGEMITSFRSSKTTQELKTSLGGSLTNSLKKNFMLFGHGQGTFLAHGAEWGGQYFSKNQLENIKAEVKNYREAREEIQKEVDEAQKEYDEAAYNSQGKSLSQDERQSIQEKQDRLNAAKQKQKEREEEYYNNQQKNKLSRQQAAAVAENPDDIPKATINYKALANSALIAGAAITAAGVAMKNSGKFSDKAADSVTALGTALIALGTAAKILQAIGNAIPALTTALTGQVGLAIAGVIAAVVAAIGLIDALTESSEEKQKRINETISKNQTHIQDLENEYKQVDDSLGSIIEKQEGLDKLTEGTVAWKDAVKELNTEIQTLVQNFPDFLEAVTIDENGRWTIDTNKVREIQKNKKKEINATKQLNFAEEYVQQEEKIRRIEQNSPVLITGKLGLSSDSFPETLYSKLEGVNYDKISQEEVNKFVAYAMTHPNAGLTDITDNFLWFKNLFSRDDLNWLEASLKLTAAPIDLSEFAEVFSAFKQISDIKKNRKTNLTSNVISYLIDQLDEELPLERYGGAFRKFIYWKATELAEQIEIKDLGPQEFEEYKEKYYQASGYYRTNGKWKDSEGNNAPEVSKDEINTYAAILQIFGQTDELIEYFKNNVNDFTLGKLNKAEYQAKIEGEINTLEEEIARYYLELFGEWDDLLKDLGIDDSTRTKFKLLPANIVSQITPLVKNIKNTYGKDAAKESVDYLRAIYSAIEGSNKDLAEEIFQTIFSELESGVISSYGQLKERLSDFKIAPPFLYDSVELFKRFQKKDTPQELIDSFSEKYSFLDSIRGGKTSYTEEEKKLLLGSGKFKESDFKKQGDTWEVINKGSETIANAFSEYLKSLYQNATDDVSKALEKKKEFKGIKEDVIKGIYKSEDKLKEILGDQFQEKINSFFAQDFSSLTEKEIKAILQYAFGYSDNLYNPVSGKHLSINNIDRDVLTNTILPWLFEDNYTELVDQQTALGQLYSTLTSAEGQMSSDTYSKLSSYINQIRNTHGDSRGNQLLSSLLNWNNKEYFTDKNGNINNFSGFLDSIGSLDWSNINNLEQFRSALEQNGVVLNGTTKELEEIYKTLESFYKISKILSIDDIKQLTSYGLQLKEEIKNKTDAGYTQEQRDFLVAANGDLEDKFIYNAETGGYTYVGQKKELESAAQYGSTQNLWNRLAAQYALAQGPKAENYAEALKYLYGIEETTKLTPDQEAEIEGFKTNKNYIKNQLELAAKMLPYAGKNNDQIREAGVADSEIQKAAALQDAAKQGFSAETLQQYAQELSNIENLTEGMAYAIAYDAMLMNKGIDDLRTNFTSLSTVLQGIEKDENGNLKITTPEQLSALTDFNKIIKDITGTTKDFSSEFLTAENTLSLLQRILSGDTSALNEFRKAAAKDLIPKNTGIKEFKDLQSAIDNFDFSGVNIGDQIDEGIEKTIDNLLDMGAIGIEQASAIYESLGFEPPEFEPQTIQYDAEMPTITTEDETASGKIGVSVPATPLTGESKAEGEVDVTIPAPVASTAGSRKEGSHARAKAGSNGINSNKSGGGGGGGNKEFKNDFDKYYNQVEDINELERQRNLLEKDYNQLLKSENLSGKEIYDNLKAQIELLKERRFLVQDLAEKRKQQILDTMQDEQYKDVAKYSWWNEEDQTIEIDWQSIDKIKDSETGDLVKEYVKKLEDFQSKYDEQINALEDIEDTLQEIKERGKEQYNTTEERLRDALIKQIQDKIDELTEVNEAINETNQKLFDSISETLELQRQERENAKTEEELTDKEKRLAYLQQDSSNANALEIAKLQEELADARESYTDTLIDQKISELQKQNEEAQEQRQEQIDLMQRSLEWQENSGAFWNTVYQYISEGTDAIGALIPGSNLVRLLKDGEAWDSLSEEMQMNWLKELETLVSEATGYLALNRQLEDIGTKEGTEIEFITADGRTLKGKVDKNGNVVVTNNDGSTSTYKDVYQDYYGTYKTLETEGELKEAPKPATTTKPEGTEKPPEYTGSDQRYTLGRNTVWSFPKKSLNGKYSSLAEAEAAARSANDSQTEILQAQINSLEKDIQDNGINTDKKTRLDNLNGLLKYRNTVGYATGGIADFTGPAWLDGTKAHPELVLNARDTQNFIELKDVLADMRKNGGLSLTGGDNYYDIKVQVDSLGSDYDVDRAIDRIKARIAQDGAYRNVNTLSRLR